MDKIDILNRESFVEDLVRMVENIAEGKKSVSFAINGTWGCGKSFVLDMLEEQLAQDQSDKYLIVHYNCWKYDYYEEPLIATVTTIMDAINEKINFLNEEQREKIKGVLKAVGTTLLSISSNTLKTATGIDVSKVFDVVKSGVDIGAAEFEKIQEYDALFGLKQALHSLQNTLNKISEQYTLVFLVDELDRCLPEYAIKVLERLHHITEITQNLIIIIAIDKEQLKASVNHIFGFSEPESAEKYLKKFIQFSIPLDLGSTSPKIVEKYKDYISLFKKELLPFEDSIEEYMQALFINVDAREQEQLVQRALLVHKLLYSDVKDYSFMCVELLIIILESYYHTKNVFTNWFGKFGLRIDPDIALIPFSSFFNNKFNNAPFLIHRYPVGTIEHCVLQRADSLYGAIAYIWYKLFLEQSLITFSVSDSTIERLLDNNIMKLKKFVEMIKLIE